MQMTQNNAAPAGAVQVTASARLHLGFLGLNGGMHRRYGSVGVGITGFSTRVNAGYSERVEVCGTDDEYIARTAQTVLDYFNINSGVKVEVEESIPRHQGLGSGTQMALALGAAITGLYGIDTGVEELAAATGRGMRSGVGLGVFQHGGFILDSGKSGLNRPPTLVFRRDFPEQWQFVLVMDEGAGGISGAEEVEAFSSLPDMPDEGADATPIAFGDFRRGYGVFDRVMMSVLRDPFTQATQGNVRFLARRRVGGQVLLAEAIRKLKCST